MMEKLHRVVITGLGAITPIGNDLDSYLQGLQSGQNGVCLLYTSPSPRDLSTSRMPSSA